MDFRGTSVYHLGVFALIMYHLGNLTQKKARGSVLFSVIFACRRVMYALRVIFGLRRVILRFAQLGRRTEYHVCRKANLSRRKKHLTQRGVSTL